VTEEFLIGELSDRAGVTLRTIRYYTSEGLLPEPIKRGSRYYYTQEHVDRLVLIDRLKRRYLPLQEIKQTLAVASDEDVNKLLGLQDALVGRKTSEPQSVNNKSDAQEYIEALLSRPEWDLNRGPIPTRGHHKTPTGTSPQSKPGKESDEVSWLHISLAPGVELQVLEALEPETKTLVEDLVRYGRQLLGRNKKEGSR
jgi:DNA-binding transcriptional MerR regulator